MPSHPKAGVAPLAAQSCSHGDKSALGAARRGGTAENARGKGGSNERRGENLGLKFHVSSLARYGAHPMPREDAGLCRLVVKLDLPEGV
jgi:hypothetical protein